MKEHQTFRVFTLDNALVMYAYGNRQAGESWKKSINSFGGSSGVWCLLESEILEQKGREEEGEIREQGEGDRQKKKTKNI